MKSLVVVALLAAGTALAAPGDIDRSFAVDGLFQLPLPTYPGRTESASSVRIDAEGNLLVAGTSTVLVGRVPHGEILARLRPDGSLDTRLAGEGFLRTPDYDLELRSAIGAYPLTDGNALVLQVNRRPCASPSAGCGLDNLGPYVFVPRRVRPDGSTDVSYFEGGFVPFPFLVDRRGVAVEPDGSFTAVGWRQVPSAIAVGVFDHDFDIVRLDGQGRPDIPFAANALASLGCGTAGRRWVSGIVARQTDGRLLVAQWVPPQEPGVQPTGCITRLNADGTRDAGFGDAGGLRAGLLSTVVGVLTRSDGGIVVVSFEHLPHSSPRSQALWLTSDGRIDSARGLQGVTYLDPDVIGRTEAVAIQDDDRLLIAGYPRLGPAFPLPGTDFGNPRVSRLDATGNLDPGYGPLGRGYVALQWPATSLWPENITIAPDGSAYVAGSALDPASGLHSIFAVAKLAGDPPRPSASGGGGGGCGIIRVDGGPLDPTLPALALLAAAMLLARMRRPR